MIKPLSNFDLMDWVKKLGIKHLRGIYSRDGLPNKIRKECGIINLDDTQGSGTHWVCYRNVDSVVEYFDPFGLIMPNEALRYILERQKGNSILDVIHNPHFDNDNSDFIKEYFGG